MMPPLLSLQRISLYPWHSNYLSLVSVLISVVFFFLLQVKNNCTYFGIVRVPSSARYIQGEPVQFLVNESNKLSHE